LHHSDSAVFFGNASQRAEGWLNERARFSTPRGRKKWGKCV
jgi:hypothetical protein